MVEEYAWQEEAHAETHALVLGEERNHLYCLCIYPKSIYIVNKNTCSCRGGRNASTLSSSDNHIMGFVSAVTRDNSTVQKRTNTNTTFS